jgi:hypothetical protein
MGEKKMVDLSRSRTAGELAVRLYDAVIDAAVAAGYGDRDYLRREIVLVDPSRGDEIGTGHAWRILWEGGPFEWGITFSLSSDSNDVYKFAGRLFRFPVGFLLEPYYSFDVGIYAPAKVAR